MSEYQMSPGERAAYANGVESMRLEIERLQGELRTVHAHLQHYRGLVDDLQGEIDVLLSKSKEAT